MKYIPNAYGAYIVDVQSASHPKGLKWEQVTWDYQGKTYTAKCVPGNTANRQAYAVDRSEPVRIILNGRNQIIAIEQDEADLVDSVEAVDYHRNGVGGYGFTVAIVKDEENDGRRMLIVDFGERGYCAVLDVDEAAKGNIYMHPVSGEDDEIVPGTGDNAWRGDQFQDTWGAVLNAEMNRRRDLAHERTLARLRAKQQEG